MGSVDTPLRGVYKRILITDRRLDVRACLERRRWLSGAARFRGEFGFDHFRKETEEL